MSEISPLDGGHADPATRSMQNGASCDAFERRRWIVPSVTPHSTLTSLTQMPLRQPLSLLFLQTSLSQCFDKDGVPVHPCPP
jgi:hypothetical protein